VAISDVVQWNGNATVDSTYYPYPSRPWSTYWPTYTYPTYTYPTYTYPTYTYTVQGEDERLRFALELIADAETLEEAQRVADKALRRG
jgi:hypothetical protein